MNVRRVLCWLGLHKLIRKDLQPQLQPALMGGVVNWHGFHVVCVHCRYVHIDGTTPQALMLSPGGRSLRRRYDQIRIKLRRMSR